MRGFREIRTRERVERLNKEDEKNKAYLNIKPSEDFKMTKEEIWDFILAEMTKAGED